MAKFSQVRPDYHRWYKTARWQRLREVQLQLHPHCQCPHHDGQRIPAEVVDHDTPHKGDLRLFWNPANLRSLAKACHDKFKQSQERGGAGFLRGCDATGAPLSKDHDWYDQR